MNRLVVVLLFSVVGIGLGFSDLSHARQVSDDLEQTVKKTSKAFANAFNSDDAKAISLLFVDGGEFIAVDRTLYAGREAIESEFAAAMKSTPGRTMNVEIDSIRQVAPGVAIEDGQATVALEDGPAFVSRYMAVHVLKGNSWKLASLRDLSDESLTHGENLLALQWLIGEWISESADGVVEHQFYWAEEGNFIMGTFHVRVDGEVVGSGSQRIGWDPQAKQIRAWIHHSNGSSSESIWTELVDRWRVKITGVTLDGKSGSATNFYVPSGGKQMLWTSTDRMIGSELGEDLEVKLVRKPPAPKTNATDE